VISVPCATPNLQPEEVWRAVLDAAGEKASVYTLVSNLTLVSVNPERAVVGHAPRDKFTAEMALSHLVGLFEKALGRRVAVSLMQTKDAPKTATLPRPPAEAPGTVAPSEPRPSGSAAPRPQPRPAAAQATAPSPQPVPAAPIDAESLKANPLVQRAAELLGAKVVRITARNAPPPPQQP